MLLYTGDSTATGSLHRLASTGPLIGMLPPGMPFQSSATPLAAHARLLLYSDGVFEIERGDKTLWTFTEFVAHVDSLLPRGDSVLEALLAKARELRGADTLADDFSLLEAQF